MVVDLGAGTLANLQRHVAIGDIDAVVLSHVHPDHWLDLPLLRNAMRYVLDIDGLPVYGTAGTRAWLTEVIGELPPTLLWHNVDGGDSSRSATSSCDSAAPTIRSRPLRCGSTPVAGPCSTAPTPGPAGTRRRGADVDLLVCEASLPPEHEGRASTCRRGRRASWPARWAPAGWSSPTSCQASTPRPAAGRDGRVPRPVRLAARCDLAAADQSSTA